MSQSALPHHGLISKVLAPALRLWLKSQLDQIETLHLEIGASDRQILSGAVPQIGLVAEKAVYQGLSLSQVQLTGQNIRVNLRQVLRGQALQILDPIAVEGRLLLSQADLNASLQAPLLATAVQAFLTELLRLVEMEGADGTVHAEEQFHNLGMRLSAEYLILRADWQPSGPSGTTEVALRTRLGLSQPNVLQLSDPQWLPHANAKRGLPLPELEGYTFDLGPQVHLSELSLQPEHLVCAGRLMVYP
jgi:hypothetical protein